MVMGVCIRRFSFNMIVRGHMYVLSWSRIRRVALMNVVSE